MTVAGSRGRAVFLDRDGVLNNAAFPDKNPRSPRTLDEVTVLPGVFDALRALRAAGFWLIVATNQPDDLRGHVSRKLVEDINEFLLSLLPLDAIEVCFHDEDDNCECRKPKPGMLLGAAQRYGLSLTRSYMVGDRWRDVEAGHRAGCRTVLVGSGYGEKLTREPNARAVDLATTARWILADLEKTRC
jgi:D-glycero-D-manno-heptose 1,7-bisphosphate phosphatase